MSRLNLQTWDQVVKGGVMKFVTSRPMTWGDTELQEGAPLPACDLLMTRNLYEQNRITVAPVEKPKAPVIIEKKKAVK